MASPSDLVGPSPVTSNGTETTEIEDEGSETGWSAPTEAPEYTEPQGPVCALLPRLCLIVAEPELQLRRLSTNLHDNFKTSLDDETVSVIHAPQGYGNFVSSSDTIMVDMLLIRGRPLQQINYRLIQFGVRIDPLPHRISSGAILPCLCAKLN